MKFHETFWAIIGGAAPVIALAAVVSLTDVGSHANRLFGILVRTGDYGPAGPPSPDQLQSPPPRWADGATQRRFNLAIYLFLAQVVNICLQAAVLAIALLSLAYQTNFGAPWGAIVVTVAGIVILAIQALRIVEVRAAFMPPALSGAPTEPVVTPPPDTA